MSKTDNKVAATYWLTKCTDQVLVGVSGGKDSVAALEVCHRAGLKLTGYFMYFVKGLRYQHEYLDYLSDRYQMQIYEYPHPDRIVCLKEGRYCLPQEHLPKLTFREVWDYARQESGVEWIVTGEKKRDSLERRAQLVSWGSVQPARRRGFPLAEWSDKDVFAYLEKNKVALAPEYADLGKSIGAMLEGRALDWIHTRYPDDYERIKADFPLCDASRIRHIALTGGIDVEEGR